jgi:antirestriction protein ArdC
MNKQQWSTLLQEAVSKPGIINRAYSAFHGYSIGNQVAAIIQCGERDITPGPINTYPGWQKLGRQVRKGQKAVWLCMPLTFKRAAHKPTEGQGEADGEQVQVITGFVWKPNWFVMSQTDGDPVPMPQTPEWDKATALAALHITEIDFDMTNGNVLGYARNRNVAISPLSPLPHKTLFHELAHVELGHTGQGEVNDSEGVPRSLAEVEAESVALIVCESLGLPGADCARGYIQGWLDREAIPEKSAGRIFGAADRILRAGRKAPEREGQA